MQDTRSRTERSIEVHSRADPRSRNGHERLHRIAGRWASRGHIIGDPPVSVAGTDTYEILPGGHFLVHHVDVIVGAQVVKAIEIIGESDVDTGGYLARSYDHRGQAEVTQLTIDDRGVFHFRGSRQTAPSAQPTDTRFAAVRSTLVLGDDGDSMTAFRERSPDGQTWRPWMDMTFRRIG